MQIAASQVMMDDSAVLSLNQIVNTQRENQFESPQHQSSWVQRHYWSAHRLHERINSAHRQAYLGIHIHYSQDPMNYSQTIRLSRLPIKVIQL
ncbi:hypothetical protein AYI82_10505 [Shewanella algae]|nr:hypothetical protein AYI82_10505 [Shewanella algae]